ncbi:isoprenylcysteine carboxylmethyltransferase family protein [Lutimonas vermicola]|uniref:Isoprenylcysteine carboxylmethyltransferase family protein n=1 Tax=Lutimonas vermicola TaxID=414288 RepID=A0ABU9KZN7_9FLAO
MIFTNILGYGFLFIFQICGCLLSLWAVMVMKLGKFNIQPEVKINAALISAGPYRLIRNPMYTGLMIFFGAGIFNSPKLINVMVFSLLVAVLLLKIQMEEKFMTSHFGQAYLQYKTKTYRLFPFLF